jgi:hypothetical protein
VEAPLIDARYVDTVGLDINPFNQSLYDHAHDYSIHSAHTDTSTNNAGSDKLSESDYVEINLIDDCNQWTFNGLYWETYVRLGEAYGEPYMVELQPVYDGSYSDFFTNLNPGSNFANLDGVVPLNNTLLNIHLVPCNLTSTGFSVRLYAIGKGTRHQLVSYDETLFANKRNVYVGEDIALPVVGNLSDGEFEINYKGGFSYLPKSGTLSIRVDLMLNISAAVTANRRELLTGDSVQALPFNIGHNEFYAFSSSVGASSGINNEELKQLGYLTAKDIEVVSDYGLTYLGEQQLRNISFDENNQVSYKQRTFDIVDRFNQELYTDDLIILKSDPLAKTFIVNITETEFTPGSLALQKIRKFSLAFEDVEIISNNVIKVKVAGGNLVPRLVDGFGNIEYSNVYLQGAYEVVDDEHLIVKNATFNGISAKDLYYEPSENVYVTIAEGDSVYLGDESPVSIFYDDHKILAENLPNMPSSHLFNETIQYKTLESNIASYPNLSEQFDNWDQQYAYAKKNVRGALCTRIKIRPKFFSISEGTTFFIPGGVYIRLKKNIILMKKDIMTNYGGTQDRFIMDEGLKTNINKAECFKTLNRLTYHKPDQASHFYTYLKYPHIDGSYEEAYAEIFNNNVINYLTNDVLDFTKNRYLDRYTIGNKFDGAFSTYNALSGTLKSYLDTVTKRRVYYIESLEPPSDMIVSGGNNPDMGSRVRILSYKNRPLNYLDSSIEPQDVAMVFDDTDTPPYGACNDLFPVFGTVKSIVEQSDGIWNINLFSPADVDGVNILWSDVVCLNDILNSTLLPADAVSLNGEPTFLWKNPKSPTIIQRVYCSLSGTSTTNKIQTLNHKYGDIPFGLQLYDEDPTADTIEHYMYIGYSVPFNYIKFVIGTILSDLLLLGSGGVGDLEYEYLSAAGWLPIQFLSYDMNTNWDGKDSNSIDFVAFSRPDMSDDNRWLLSTIPENPSENKYWIKIKIPVESHSVLSYEDRKDLYPSFRDIVVGSVFEGECSYTDGTITYTSTGTTTGEIRIEGQDFTASLWDYVKQGDTIFWTEDTTGVRRVGTISGTFVVSPDGVSIDVNTQADLSSHTISEISIRRNPFAFVKNTKYTIDRHVNTQDARENRANPFDPVDSAGFKRSPAYSIKKQQWLFYSDDAAPDVSATAFPAIRTAYDQYEVGHSPQGSTDIDKLFFDANFIFTSVNPSIKASRVDDIVSSGDTVRLNQRLWINHYAPANSPSNDLELYYYICRPVDEDRYYLTVIANDPSLLPNSEEDLSAWNLGAFNNKYGYIWNENVPILSRLYPYELPYGSPDTSYSYDNHSLDFNQRIERYHKNKSDSFGGNDVIGFIFDTNDIFESYDLNRPDFYGLTYTPNGQLWPYTTPGTINFDTGGYYRVVLPIHVTSFGDIFDNYYAGSGIHGGFYYSKPRAIMTKEYAIDSSAYRVSLLEFLNSATSYKHVDDIVKEDADYVMLLDDTDRSADINNIRRIYNGEYDECSLVIDTNNEHYLDMRIAYGRTQDDSSSIDHFSDLLNNLVPKFLASNKEVDLGKNADLNASISYESPVEYTISANSSAKSLANLSLDLGDGLYCFSVPLQNIKHYNPLLAGTLYGVDAQLSDSYKPVDDLFSGVSGCYEITGKRDWIHPENSLIWAFGKFGGRAGLYLANWGATAGLNYVNDTSDWHYKMPTLTYGLLNKFNAVGDGTEASPGDWNIETDKEIVSLDKLIDFLKGASVFVRVYRYDKWNTSDGWLKPEQNECYDERFIGIIDNAEPMPVGNTSSAIAKQFKALRVKTSDLARIDVLPIESMTTPFALADDTKNYLFPPGMGAYDGSAGRENCIAWGQGSGNGWTFQYPMHGMQVLIVDENKIYTFVRSGVAGQHIYSDNGNTSHYTDPMGCWTTGIVVDDTSNDADLISDVLLTFKEEASSIWSRTEPHTKDGNIAYDIIKYHLHDSMYSANQNHLRELNCWTETTASALKTDIVTIPQIATTAGLTIDYPVFGIKHATSGFASSGYKADGTLVSFDYAKSLDTYGDIALPCTDLFSNFVREHGVFRLIRNSFDRALDYGIRTSSTTDGTPNVLGSGSFPLAPRNAGSVPYFIPTNIEDRVYDESGFANYGHLSHHYIYELVFRKAKDDVYNVINILEDPARAELITSTPAPRIYSANFGAGYNVEPYANTAYHFSSHIPSYNRANARLLVFFYKNQDTVSIEKYAIQAKGLDAYYSATLTSLVGDISKHNTYEIMSSDSTNNQITILDTTDIVWEDVSRQSTDAYNVIFVPYGASAAECPIYPGQAIVDQYSPDKNIYGYIDSIEYFGYTYNSSESPGVDAGRYYKLNLSNGKHLNAGTYDVIFTDIPLITKVPEDYTRHVFYTCDYTADTVWMNNLQFNYYTRKVLKNNNSVLYERGNITVTNAVSNTYKTFVNRHGYTVKITRGLPNFFKPIRIADISNTVIASQVFTGTNGSFYQMFQLVNNQMLPVNSRAYQLIGSLNTMFLCVDDTKDNNIYQLYNPSTKSIGGGIPNTEIITAANVSEFAPITQYAYEFVNPSTYVFSMLDKTYTIYPPDNQLDELDFNKLERVWAGNIGDRNFYLVSRGTKGFGAIAGHQNVSVAEIENPQGTFSYEETYPQITLQGDALDNFKTYVYEAPSGIHVIALGLWYGDWLEYNKTNTSNFLTIYDSSDQYEFDYNHPIFYKYATPMPHLYEPSVAILSSNTLGLPHYRYDEVTKNIVPLFATTDKDVDNKPNQFGRTNFFPIPDDFEKHTLYLFLNEKAIINHNLYTYDSVTGSRVGAETQNIWEVVGNQLDVALQASIDAGSITELEKGNYKVLVFNHLISMLKSNPIATFTSNIKFNISASTQMKLATFNLPFSSNIYFIAGLNKGFNIDLSPFVSGYFYSNEDINKWNRNQTFSNLPEPPRRDGKPTDLEMVESSLSYGIDRMSNEIGMQSVYRGVAGYYAKALYTQKNADWETVINNLAGFQLGPSKILGMTDANVDDWIKPEYLDPTKYIFRISIITKQYNGNITRSFIPSNIADFNYFEQTTPASGSNIVVNAALNCNSALFDLNQYEKVRVKLLIENGSQATPVTPYITPAADYQWVYLDDVMLEVFEITDPVTNIYSNDRIVDRSVVFSALDYNKLTRAFDIRLDDDHLRFVSSHNEFASTTSPGDWFGGHIASAGVSDTNLYSFGDLDEFDDDPNGIILNDGNIPASYIEDRITNEELIDTGAPVYQSKINSTIGVGRRINYDLWRTYPYAEYPLTSDHRVFRGNGSSIMPTSTYLYPLSETKTYSLTLKDTLSLPDSITLDKDFYYYGDTITQEDLLFYQTFQSGYCGIYHGFRPNAMIVGRNAQSNMEIRRGLYYFAIPNLPDYMRLPKWLLDNPDDIYLECWTKDGWQRCPIEKRYRDINIRMPHLRHTPITKSRPFQDVIYTEVLPLIPDDILPCGPGTSNPLPFDFGYTLSNTVYYPGSNIYDMTKPEGYRWRLYKPAWGTDVADFSVRPIGGYWFRFVTSIGGNCTPDEYFDGQPDTSLAEETVLSYAVTPPSDPRIGDKYLVKSSATGLWSGYDDAVIEWNYLYSNSDTAGWIPLSGYSPSSPGLGYSMIYVLDEMAFYSWESPGGWTLYTPETTEMVPVAGNIESSTGRDLIFRALHTTPPQFINIAQSDCWIDDVNIAVLDESNYEIKIVVAGYKTENSIKRFKTETHSVLLGKQ